MKYLRAITVLSLRMVRQELGKHIQWKEEQEKRFCFIPIEFICICLGFQFVFVADKFVAFCRMGSFLMMRALSQERLSKFLIY